MTMKFDVKEIESVCTYCGVGCDITGVVQNNKITKIYAQKDGVVSQGKLCIKGKYGYDFVEAEDRVREPRIRKSFLEKNPEIHATVADKLHPFDETFVMCDLDTATTIATMKLAEIKETFGGESFCAIGGARTNCESAIPFQKVLPRRPMNSPHVDQLCEGSAIQPRPQRGCGRPIGEGACKQAL